MEPQSSKAIGRNAGNNACGCFYCASGAKPISTKQLPVLAGGVAFPDRKPPSPKLLKEDVKTKPNADGQGGVQRTVRFENQGEKRPSGSFLRPLDSSSLESSTRFINAPSSGSPARLPDSRLRGDIGVIGLAVMGQNLILNMNDHGFVVVAYNRSVDKVDNFLCSEALGTQVLGAHSMEELVQKLKSPRKVMLMVKAGKPVDDFIEQLVPLLDAGDVIIDGGNSEYADTRRRTQDLQSKGLYFVGCGVSGGEEGARHGPSLMPGGSPEAWPFVKDIFQSICAKVDGEPCCDWVGEDGAGHFVKMVHNGIEYGDMQLIAEAYHLLRDIVGLDNEEMSEVFTKWNRGVLDSFLIEVTSNILKYKDESGQFLIDKIRDAAGQKGTGKWSTVAAMEYGVPVTLIGEAVFARCLSALKDERTYASKKLRGPRPREKYPVTGSFLSAYEKEKLTLEIEQALYAAKIVSYAQGFMLFREAAKQNKWRLNYGGIALMWRGGCIIRSAFLGDIKNAFDKNPDLTNLLLDRFFREAISDAQHGWRAVVATAAIDGIPIPAMSSALSFYDGFRLENLPANMLQAQRDYFGAHTYELLGAPGNFVHTNWTGKGGTTASSTYQA